MGQTHVRGGEEPATRLSGKCGTDRVLLVSRRGRIRAQADRGWRGDHAAGAGHLGARAAGTAGLGVGGSWVSQDVLRGQCVGTDAVLGPLSALKGKLGLPCPCLGLTTVEQGIHTGQDRLGSHLCPPLCPPSPGMGGCLPCPRWCGCLYDNLLQNAWKRFGNGAEGSNWVNSPVGSSSQNTCFNRPNGAPESLAWGIPHAQYMRYLLGRNTSAAVTASLQAPPSFPSCQGPAFL